MPKARGTPRATDKGDFMTLVSRISACALAALMAIPAVAQTRHRAVPPTGQAGPTVQVTITAKDASNGVPAEDSFVTYGAQTLKTNSNGQVQITLPTGKPSTISVEHPAFNTATQVITAQAGGKYDITLTEKPSVTIKTTAGGTTIVDVGTAQFAYAPALSSYIRTDKGNFCKQDGTDFTPDKTEFTRIVGPATSMSSPACCQFGNVLSANVEMKSGAKLLVFFKDNCSGDDVAFVGREKATGRYQYFRFTDVAEIAFQ
jgi:hypothetical protein